MEIPPTLRADQPRSRRGRGPLTEEVERMLRGKLIRDPCTAAMAARLYSVSRRTLYRYLKAEGRTFRQVANEIRCEIACTLLAETDLPLSQIAEVLNYSETGAFSRAFRRWSGQPPSAWRSSHPELTGWSGRRLHQRLRRS
jgi:AraC-like DNA-binding protein